mmetsp:Transcript_31420/g.75962  ORF Transcript_31420/g.75962 Transcript_31420/m.75962 type:complete len:100 (-) Transcript_31420:636-935(-)
MTPAKKADSKNEKIKVPALSLSCLTRTHASNLSKEPGRRDPSSSAPRYGEQQGPPDPLSDVELEENADNLKELISPNSHRDASPTSTDSARFKVASTTG